MTDGPETNSANMEKIILEAGASDYGIYWEQLGDWEEALEIIRDNPRPWSEYDDMVVYGVFLDILSAMELEDTGFESYEQMQAAQLRQV